MDLILKISKEEIGLITDVYQLLFIETIREGYVFNGDLILETDPTEQCTSENLITVFLDMNSLSPLQCLTTFCRAVITKGLTTLVL